MLLCDPDLITVTNFIIIFITLLINVWHKEGKSNSVMTYGIKKTLDFGKTLQ